MKKTLVIQLRPEDDVSNSEFEAILSVGKIPYKQVHRLRIETTGIPDINPHHYNAIIVGGSPLDISTPETLKSSAQKKIETDFRRLFDTVIPHDIPFFGACSGNGLLGHYLGATISRQYGEPAGGIEVQLTDAGKQDPLLCNLPDAFQALVGHKEACDATPPGATLLASSQACPVQMFRVGSNIYATQFHPESDANVFIKRAIAYKNNGYFSPEDVELIVANIAQVKTPVAHQILHNFTACYC